MLFSKKKYHKMLLYKKFECIFEFTRGFLGVIKKKRRTR